MKTFIELDWSVRPSCLRPRDHDNYKGSAASCPITKASNISNFHIPQIFSFSIFPVSIRDFFLFFVTFSHLRNLKECKNAISLESLYHNDIPDQGQETPHPATQTTQAKNDSLSSPLPGVSDMR